MVATGRSDPVRAPTPGLRASERGAADRARRRHACGDSPPRRPVTGREAGGVRLQRGALAHRPGGARLGAPHEGCGCAAFVVAGRQLDRVRARLGRRPEPLPRRRGSLAAPPPDRRPRDPRHAGLLPRRRLDRVHHRRNALTRGDPRRRDGAPPRLREPGRVRVGARRRRARRDGAVGASGRVPRRDRRRRAPPCRDTPERGVAALLARREARGPLARHGYVGAHLRLRRARRRAGATRPVGGRRGATRRPRLVAGRPPSRVDRRRQARRRRSRRQRRTGTGGLLGRRADRVVAGRDEGRGGCGSRAVRLTRRHRRRRRRDTRADRADERLPYRRDGRRRRAHRHERRRCDRRARGRRPDRRRRVGGRRRRRRRQRHDRRRLVGRPHRRRFRRRRARGRRRTRRDHRRRRAGRRSCRPGEGSRAGA